MLQLHAMFFDFTLAAFVMVAAFLAYQGLKG